MMLFRCTMALLRRNLALLMLVCSVSVVSEAAPQRRLVVTRKHTVGQRYQVKLSVANWSDGKKRSETMLHGTARVTKAMKGEAHFEVSISIDHLPVPGSPWTEKRTDAGIVASVVVRPKTINAKLLQEGSSPEAAEMALTWIEMMMGDFCRPPEDKPLNGDWKVVSNDETSAFLENRWEDTRGTDQKCSLLIAHEDDFSGNRTGTMITRLPPSQPGEAVMEIKQVYEINITTLR